MFGRKTKIIKMLTQVINDRDDLILDRENRIRELEMKNRELNEKLASKKELYKDSVMRCPDTGRYKSSKK